MDPYNSRVVYMLLVVFTPVTTCYIVHYPFNNNCATEFFYKGEPPLYFIARGKNPLNRKDVFICQQLQVNGTEYFLTRYSKQKKIPIYSAYKIQSFSDIHKKSRPSWKTESELPISNQATTDDYNTTYNKGHLNPRSFNLYSVESIKATFTLTNAVPMKWEFNKKWYDYAEAPLFKRMKKDCNFINATRYILTGVIPGDSWIGSRVYIPTYIWTAACCDTVRGVIPLQTRWFEGYLMKSNHELYVFKNLLGFEKQLMGLLPKTRVKLNMCEDG